MKKAIIAGLTFATVAASAAQYVTVQVCDRGESGTQCETITYAVRPSTGVPQEFNPGSAEYAHQNPSAYGVPAWLAALNSMFANGGQHGNNPSNPNFEAP